MASAPPVRVGNLGREMDVAADGPVTFEEAVELTAMISLRK